ncbi:MAG: hypothetical protein ACKV2T_20620 [Kofleriaceae bacterium]
MREHSWWKFDDIAPILEAAPLSLVATALAKETRPELARQLAMLDRREDEPSALLAAARELVPGRAQTILAVVAADRALRRGDIVPDELEQLVVFAHTAEAVELAGRFVDVLRRLPADRVNTWARARLDDDGAVVLAFAAHGDDTILRDVLREGGYVEPSLFEVLGAPAIPTLLAAAGTLRDARGARARHAFVFALAGAVAAGVPIDPAWDLELLVAGFEGRPTEREPYNYLLEQALMRVFPALPRPRREVLLNEAIDPAPMCVVQMLSMIESDDELDGYLRSALARGMINAVALRKVGERALPALCAYGPTAPNPAWVREQAEEAFPPEQFAIVAAAFETARGRMWNTIADEAARACSASPSAARTRVYLLEPDSFTWPARDGSRSRLGGRAPGSRAPSGMFHLMTIDLAEVPELAAWYPKAGALSMFCTRLSEDELDEEPSAEVKELATAPAPPTEESDVQSLAIFGIEVPADVFGDPNNLPSMPARCGSSISSVRSSPCSSTNATFAPRMPPQTQLWATAATSS